MPLPRYSAPIRGSARPSGAKPWMPRMSGGIAERSVGTQITGTIALVWSGTPVSRAMTRRAENSAHSRMHHWLSRYDGERFVDRLVWTLTDLES